jgi:hypothetical protein
VIHAYVRVETVHQRIAVYSINDKIVTFEVNGMVDFKAVIERNKAKAAAKAAGTKVTKTAAPDAATRLGPAEFGDLDASGPARLTFGMEEKLSGPSGTFSTVSVRVELSVQCAQNEEQIRRAAGLLQGEVAHLADHYINPAMELLLEHVERHKR